MDQKLVIRDGPVRDSRGRTYGETNVSGWGLRTRERSRSPEWEQQGENTEVEQTTGMIVWRSVQQADSRDDRISRDGARRFELLNLHEARPSPGTSVTFPHNP